MMAECPNEQAVVNAVLGGAWPDRANEALVTHAASCSTCSEIAHVAVLLREDIDQSRVEVHVPAAGQVWWRAAVRARLESTHAAAKPMTWMHAITGAVVFGVLLAGLTAIWPMMPSVVNLVRSMPLELMPSHDVASAIAGGLAQSVLIGVIAAALLVAAPLAVYFALLDD